jgi:hypothetical protein
MEIEFTLTGSLGVMTFPDVLAALQRGYDVLVAVQRQVLGERAREVRWSLTDLRPGSAATRLRASGSSQVTDLDLEQVVDAFADGTQALLRGAEVPPPFFDTAALAAYRDLVRELRQGRVGDLVAVTPGGDIHTVAIAVAEDAFPPVLRRLDERFTVLGSVIGRIEAINLHEKREVTLWSDLDEARVRVSFPEQMYGAVHAALRHRVEAIGEVTEDADGRPLSLKLHALEVLPSTGDDLPTLESLVGSMPGLTGGLDPREWLAGQRRDMGVG